ncbi:GMC family oxidoreductase [Pseudomonas cavernicola]|uniref:GMC family oxidoreductase n=1 Tax=Pseudomonas cavernicola TaxID=2320866 RepID=A0A418X8Q8_9PSED|nr:NAD(P)-binding protein [Pseudomonas cavernicola]RJG08876.1 GMC family oxidoreductase [Pseudomonas cavernicola]
MSEQPLAADYVVIGSGICGSLVAHRLAHRLAQQGASVLILEAGPRIRRDDIFKAFLDSPRKRDFQAPYPFSPWAPHPDFQPVDNDYLQQAGPDPYKAEYLRVVGGTTWHWSAMAWRMVRNDFRLQTLYGIGVDWPFDYETLDPFYQEAEEIMGVAGSADEHPESPRTRPFPLELVAEPFAIAIAGTLLRGLEHAFAARLDALNAGALQRRGQGGRMRGDARPLREQCHQLRLARQRVGPSQLDQQRVLRRRNSGRASRFGHHPYAEEPEQKYTLFCPRPLIGTS